MYFKATNEHIYIYPAIDTSELGTNSSLSYSDLVDYDYEQALKGLFIKTKSGSAPSGASYTISSYDGLKGINVDKIGKCPENESSIYCATYPTISNIKLLNNLSINVDPDSQGKFNVIRPGFYYVTFNTNVNEEQVPISKLTVRVYKEGDDWTSDTGLKELDNLDAKPLPTNPHKIGIFLSSGTYQIMAKVVDNWTKFGCASSPSKDFSNVISDFSNVISDCSKCCGDGEEKTPFKDEIGNSQCSDCF